MLRIADSLSTFIRLTRINSQLYLLFSTCRRIMRPDMIGLCVIISYIGYIQRINQHHVVLFF